MLQIRQPCKNSCSLGYLKIITILLPQCAKCQDYSGEVQFSTFFFLFVYSNLYLFLENFTHEQEHRYVCVHIFINLLTLSLTPSWSNSPILHPKSHELLVLYNPSGTPSVLHMPLSMLNYQVSYSKRKLTPPAVIKCPQSIS